MKRKTISGHYDKVYSLDHNNRTFIPKNVGQSRILWNYSCVAAGQLYLFDPDIPINIHTFWESYHRLAAIYWSDRSIWDAALSEEYLKLRNSMRQYYNTRAILSHEPLAEFLAYLLFPMLIFCDIYMDYKYECARAALDEIKKDQQIRDLVYKTTKTSLRNALLSHDLETGSHYLHIMDEAPEEKNLIIEPGVTDIVGHLNVYSAICVLTQAPPCGSIFI